MPGLSAARWHGVAFGLALDSATALPGCEAGDPVEALAGVRLDPASTADIAADGASGFAFAVPGVAHFHVSASGQSVRYAAAGAPAWRWQRYLHGRILPLAATLLGLEPVHASAVVVPDGAVLLAGPPGAGKSTLAVELVRGGARFMADDVAALAVGDGALYAHCGPGLISLRHGAATRLGASVVSALGEPLGRDEDSVRIRLARARQPRVVRALYLLERGGPGETPALNPGAPDPAALLATSFNLALRDGARLERQLDVFARLAADARLARVRVPAGAEPAGVAEVLRADLSVLGLA